MLDQVIMPRTLAPHAIPDLPHTIQLMVTREDEQFLGFLHHLLLVGIPYLIRLFGQVHIVFDDIQQGVWRQDLLPEVVGVSGYNIYP